MKNFAKRQASRLAAKRAAAKAQLIGAAPIGTQVHPAEPGLSLDVSDLGDGIALVAIEHELLGPLVRETAHGLADYLREPGALRCGRCGVRPSNEWLAIGPTNPPARALITRCPNCMDLQPAIDQRLAIVAMRHHLEDGALAALQGGYVELLEQDEKARHTDAAWFAAHPARQYRAREPLTAQERQQSHAQPAGPWPMRMIVQRRAELHQSAVAVPLPKAWIEAMHAQELPAELLREDRAEDALLGELFDLQQGEQPKLMNPMELMLRAVVRAKTALTTAEATRSAGKKDGAA